MKQSILTLIIGISAALLTGFGTHRAVGADGKDGIATSKAAVPAALVGTWRSGSLMETSFCDPTTQQWHEPAGRGTFLIIQANGEYRFGAGEEIATTQYFLYQEGAIAVNGSQIVLSPKSGSEFTRVAGASPRYDWQTSSGHQLQPSSFTFQLVVEKGDSSGPSLLLTDQFGERITLRPIQ